MIDADEEPEPTADSKTSPKLPLVKNNFENQVK
jgi:hypothetical protein